MHHSNPVHLIFCSRWLLGLLVLQSTSSFVLESYQQLIKENLVVTVFLTMLVGAGGNAGNQSAIKVIRGLVSNDAVSPFKLHACSGMHAVSCKCGWAVPDRCTGSRVTDACAACWALLTESHTSRDCAAGDRPNPRHLAVPQTDSEAASTDWTHAGQWPFR